ncbi:hypothetical protein AK51_33625 [Serratia nematodiphila DZ0503SBS1]|nr:hypothetical protein AK51_33625 [Serratia nematodiphila DZ0503SBS1]
MLEYIKRELIHGRDHRFTLYPHVWNEYVLNPRSCEYNLVLDQTIEGALDVDRLRAAVDGVCRDYILFHHVLDDSSPQLRWVKTEMYSYVRLSIDRCTATYV